MPPVAITVCIYCKPPVPLGSDAVVIIRGPVTFTVNGLLAVVPSESVTVTTSDMVPAGSAVPERTPLAEMLKLDAPDTLQV